MLREAFEETGLIQLTLAGFLGKETRDMSDFGLAELHYRRFYHLRLRGDAPPAWRHYESDPSDGSTAPIPLDFYWVNLPHEAPELIAGHGVMIPKLLQVMEETGP